MKLELVTREACDDYIASRFPQVPSLTHEDWKQNRDRVEKSLLKYGHIDHTGIGTVGDFSVTDDWFGSQTVHVGANTRKMVSAAALDDVLRVIESHEPEYCVTFVGTYPQVLLIWTIALTRGRKLIAFGPTFEERMRDASTDPEVNRWVKALDRLWE